MMSSPSLLFAFTAGIVSFLSPCVLLLIPGFLTYLAGASLKQAGSKRGAVFLNSLCFVIGFSVIFSALGILLTTLLDRVAYDVQLWLSRLGGIIIILFGLELTGLVKIPWLERKHSFAVDAAERQQEGRSRYGTSFLFGAAFAAGWTPCVGAVLGSILALAATRPGTALGLLLSYSLGLGLPFLATGLFAGQASRLITRSAGTFRYITIIFGIVLIALGILIFTQSLNLIANFSFLNKILLRM